MLNLTASQLAGVLTPALAIFTDVVDRNIETTIRILGNDPERWRPHVKTAKLLSTMRQLVQHGVRTCKCATTLELRTACEAGFADVLVAYPCFGTRGLRLREIADEYPAVAISVLIEDIAQLPPAGDRKIGVFVDVNPGANRTGIEQERVGDIVALARAIVAQGFLFRGLHYYDGHHRQPDLAERCAAAFQGYDRLLLTVAALGAAGFAPGEIVTSGTTSFPCAVQYPGFRNAAFQQRSSPGTLVYNDTTSATQLPAEWGFEPAVVVISTVVSHPADGIVTCDAGHKAVSADAGVPTCAVAGRPELTPLGPSEEHLPIQVAAGAKAPEIGEILYLIPRHVCPTVNNFDRALLIRDGKIVEVAAVTARGREGPLLAAAHQA